MGEIFGVALKRECQFEGGAYIKLTFSSFYLNFYFMFMLMELVLCFEQYFNYGFATYVVKHFG